MATPEPWCIVYVDDQCVAYSTDLNTVSTAQHVEVLDVNIVQTHQSGTPFFAGQATGLILTLLGVYIVDKLWRKRGENIDNTHS